MIKAHTRVATSLVWDLYFPYYYYNYYLKKINFDENQSQPWDLCWVNKWVCNMVYYCVSKKDNFQCWHLEKSGFFYQNWRRRGGRGSLVVKAASNFYRWSSVFPSPLFHSLPQFWLIVVDDTVSVSSSILFIWSVEWMLFFIWKGRVEGFKYPTFWVPLPQAYK